MQFISFWVILFTGKYPESFFEYQVKYLRWKWRVNARLANMADDYPAFGLDVDDDEFTSYEVPYLEEQDRVSVLLRGLFGFIYVIIPHGFVLFFLGVVVNLFVFLAWWIVLFTGKYPYDMFKFNLNVFRWVERVNLYMMYLSDVYPPFSLEPESEDMLSDDDMENSEEDDESGEDDNDDIPPKKDDFV